MVQPARGDQLGARKSFKITETPEGFWPRKQAPTTSSDRPGRRGSKQASSWPGLCSTRRRTGPRGASWDPRPEATGPAGTHLHGQPQLLDPVLPFLRPGARFSVVPPQEVAPHQEAGLPLLWPVPHDLWGSAVEVGAVRGRRAPSEGLAGAGPATHLVDAIVPVALGGRVLAVLATLHVPHHPHRLPGPPVLGLGPLAVVDGGAAVQSQRPVGRAGAPQGVGWIASPRPLEERVPLSPPEPVTVTFGKWVTADGSQVQRRSGGASAVSL